MRVRDIGGYKNALNVLWESVIFFRQITVQRYLFCLSTGGLYMDLIYPVTSLYEHILLMHLEKHRTYAPTFPVQLKGISKCRQSPFYYDVFFEKIK